jgi:hypothetical protein
VKELSCQAVSIERTPSFVGGGENQRVVLLLDKLVVAKLIDILGRHRTILALRSLNA